MLKNIKRKKPETAAKYQEKKPEIVEKYQDNKSQIAAKYQDDKSQIAEKNAYSMEKFLKEINEIADEYCQICRKWKFRNSLQTMQKVNLMQDKKEVLDQLEDSFLVCSTYASHLKRKSTPVQAFWNVRDPGVIPKQIAILTPLEKKTLCRLNAFVNITRYEGKFGHLKNPKFDGYLLLSIIKRKKNFSALKGKKYINKYLLEN